MISDLRKNCVSSFVLNVSIGKENVKIILQHVLLSIYGINMSIVYKQRVGTDLGRVSFTCSWLCKLSTDTKEVGSWRREEERVR